MADPIPFSPPETAAAPQASLAKVRAATVFVRAMRIEAEIGIHAHEYGRTQPLIVDVEMEIATDGFDNIHDTVNYEAILQKARAVAAQGHVKLVEAYAEHLARACLEDPRVRRVKVRVEKPEALAPHAEAAGVELVLERA